MFGTVSTVLRSVRKLLKQSYSNSSSLTPLKRCVNEIARRRRKTKNDKLKLELRTQRRWLDRTRRIFTRSLKHGVNDDHSPYSVGGYEISTFAASMRKFLVRRNHCGSVALTSAAVLLTGPLIAAPIPG